MFKFLTTTITAALVSGSLSAQSMSDAEWDKVRSFLDSNPNVLAQINGFIDRMPAENQMELDAQFIQENSATLFENKATPRMGAGQGAITLIKFNDFRCGYCRRLSSTMDELMADNDQVEIIVREFPILGPQSDMAAKFALAVWDLAGRDGYETAHDALFAANGEIDDALIRKTSLEIGLDPETVLVRMEKLDIAAHIAETKEIAAALKITGTPAIIIGDTVARGALPLDILKEAIAETF